MRAVSDSEAGGVVGTPGRQNALGRFAEKFPPHVVFLVVGGINAILLCFLTPPFQVPDEFQHFFRSYQLSEGRLWGTVQNGRPGDVIPSSLPDFVRRTWGEPKIWFVPPLKANPLAGTWSEFGRALSPDRVHFAEFSTTGYSPLLYIPQTIGVAAGRAIGAPPMALLILGRLANAMTGVAMIAWALKALPTGRAIALAAALLPMAQFEYGSVAPDATIIASAFLMVALVLRASLFDRWALTDIVVSSVAASIVCAKVVYAPMLLIGAPAVISHRGAPSFAGVARRVWPHCVIAAFALGATGAWFGLAHPLAVSLTPADFVAARRAAIFEQPLRFAVALLDDFYVNDMRYYVQFVGVLGALEVFLPARVYILAFAAFVLSLGVPTKGERSLDLYYIVWSAIISLAIVNLIQAALFDFFVPQHKNSWEIAGVQGRYFLPLGGLVAATLGSIKAIPRFREVNPLAYFVLVGILLVDTVSMDATIIRGFGLF